MDRYKCRFCFKIFANGRALGGHMRSHMLSLSSKRDRYHDIEEDDEEERPSPLSDEIESGELPPSSSASSFSSSSSSEEEDGDDERGNVGEMYGLRKNPKRNIGVADQEFASAVDDIGYAFLQDGESEAESSEIYPTRRRSKRTRKLGALDVDHNREEHSMKSPKTSHVSFIRTEPEPLRSVSDTTTEEDLAFCLMMLSRDKWKQKNKRIAEIEDDHGDRKDQGNGTEESEYYKSIKNKARDKYKCETCDRVFKSYQALGGHRASHKKNRVCRAEHHRRGSEFEVENVVVEKKIHECPICLRLFSSGQALGGHKRSHGIIRLPQNHVIRIEKEASTTKQRFIDLNLPAPTEDSETSQAEVSVVFDEC